MAFRSVVAGAVVSQIAAFNPRRSAITIKSLGAVRVFIGQDSPGLLDLGFALDRGEYLSLIGADGDDPRAALYAVTAAADVDLRIQESFES